MNRRGFLGAILAAAVAPAIVRASSLMPIVSRVNGAYLVFEDYDLLKHAAPLFLTYRIWRSQPGSDIFIPVDFTFDEMCSVLRV